MQSGPLKRKQANKKDADAEYLKEWHWLVEDQVRREVQHPCIGVLVRPPTQSKDHHSHPGMLYHCHLIIHVQIAETWETERWRDICGLLLLPISHSLSAAWALLLQTEFIYDSISALPARAMNHISPVVTSKKRMFIWISVSIEETMGWRGVLAAFGNNTMSVLRSNWISLSSEQIHHWFQSRLKCQFY